VVTGVVLPGTGGGGVDAAPAAEAPVCIWPADRRRRRMPANAPPPRSPGVLAEEEWFIGGGWGEDRVGEPEVRNANGLADSALGL